MRDKWLELERRYKLFYSGVFLTKNNQQSELLEIFRESAFIELLIKLNDILQYLKNENKRVTFKDYLSNDKDVQDITDLINWLRNAACHSTSSNRNVKSTTIIFTFNTIVGYNPNAFKLGESIILGCEFEDDIAYYYGDKRIYVMRHIAWLLSHLKSIFANGIP